MISPPKNIEIKLKHIHIQILEKRGVVEISCEKSRLPESSKNFRIIFMTIVINDHVELPVYTFNLDIEKKLVTYTR